MSKITINNITVDPSKAHFVQLQNFTAHSTQPNKTYLLIQADRPLLPEEKRQLRKIGVELLEYVPENAYIARARSTDLAEISALPFLTWVGPYLQYFKIAPELQALTHALSAHPPPLVPPHSAAPREVEVVLHRATALTDVKNQLAQVVGVNLQDLPETGAKVRLVLTPEKIAQVAQLEEVRHVEEIVAPKLFNDQANRILNCRRLHTDFDLRGEGEVVAVCDTGFDTGSAQNVHPAFSGRVARLYCMVRMSANDPNGHGTHVAGSAVGAPIAGGDPNIHGAAPAATLVLQSILDQGGGLRGLPTDLQDLFRAPYMNDNARVHTNSWGSPERGRYSQSAYEVDKFIWENRDLVVCFAAGNEGTDANGNGVVDNGSIASPGTAKNCITVGACESSRPAQSRTYGEWPQFPSEPINSDLWADNPEGIAAFSSRGPTQDGRIKPDVVAPGTSILSTQSRDAAAGDFWGRSNDPLLAYMGGTSMATPLVAGCAAIVRQYLRMHLKLSPSAALVKALLINSAKDLEGQYVPSEASAIPNFAEGFGRVNMANLADTAGTNRLYLRDEDRALETGEEDFHKVPIPAPGMNAKVTLVWTDPPGESLQNDLDLIVRYGVEEVHGNQSAGSIAFDRTNNVEQVVWAGLGGGQLDVVVRAHRAATSAQSYAIAVRYF